MNTPRYRTACPPGSSSAARAVVLTAPDRMAIPHLLLLVAVLSAVALPAFAQDPVFQVPVLEDVDPAKVEFNDHILERDRTQPGMGEPVQTPNPNDQRASAGGVGGAGGGSSGGYGRAPSIFQGGPQMPTASSGSGGDGGIDVNVSVSGQQLPSIFQGDGGGAGSPGMPGSPGSPGMPGSTGSSGSANGDSDGDGDIDINVNVTGGPQLPTLNIPGLPGMEGSGTGMPGSSMPGMPGSSPGSGNGSASGSGSSSGDGSMAGTGQGTGSAGSMPGSMPGATGAGTRGGTMAGSSGGAGGTGMGTIGGGSARAAVLDRRLEESFGVFDGMIIAEREKAQSEADAAGSSVMGTGGGGEGDGGEGADGGTFGGAPEGTILVAGGPQNSTGGGILPNGGSAREGEFSHNDQPAYPIPEDIPDGDDDDVVARQLREAAMSEPDPELREKLWDEYRKYTGLSQ